MLDANNFSFLPYRLWETYGVEIVISTANITTLEGCEEIVNAAIKLGPVGGIFNLAGVISDSLFAKMDAKSFMNVVLPKAQSTMHLDTISRRLCQQLDHFVVFSSISCGYGNAGQTNYGFANSVAERIVEKRRLDGLPGQAIQWGPVDDVGMMKKVADGKELTTFFGMIPQKITACFNVSLNNILSSNETIVSSVVVADKKISHGGDQQSFETMLIAMGFPDIKTMDRNKPIVDLGMDSIGGTEIQQTLEREFGITMTFQELRTKTLNQIEALIKGGAKSNQKMATVTSFLDEMWKNLRNGTTSEKLIEELKFVDSKPKILLIPGMISDMGCVWEELDYSIYVCHHIKYHRAQSFDELVNSIIADVLDLYEKETTFVLVGFSFGSTIALKVCEILESTGKHGHLILIDGSPSAMRLNVSETVNNVPATDEDIQNFIFEEFAGSKYGAMEVDILRTVFSHTTWNGRIAEYLQYINDEQTKKFVERNFEALFHRLKMVANEDFGCTISEYVSVTLIKPSNILSKISQDYGLREYCKGAIRIETVPADYSTILESPDIVDIIESF